MILETRALSKHFGGIRAVDELDLSLAGGELVGLIGPNGSGKTTVFNLVTGIYAPDAGSVSFDGRDIGGLPPHRINRLGIARTFQNIRIFRNLSVLDNVKVARHALAAYGPVAAVCRTGRFRAGETGMTEECGELLEIFSLRDRRHEVAGNLPYGDQRKLEIARALASRPRVLLLDEPAAGMNPFEVARLKKLILDIRERFGLTILLIEHRMSLVMEICERIAVMDFGRLIAQGRAAEIRGNPRVVEAYLGRETLPEEMR
ncbi:MAG: ABC transporter ATP-binding protein [Gemmatimonadota bacterium]